MNFSPNLTALESMDSNDGFPLNASKPYHGYYQSRPQQKMSSLEKFGNEYMEVHGFLSLVVCALGIPMNLLNVFVLKRQHMHTPVNTILTWLAVFDFLTMACYLPFSLHFYCFESTWHASPRRNSLGWMTFLIFHIDFTATTHTISNWLAVILAMFRYRHLFSPAKGDLTRMRRLVRARLAVFSVVVLSIIIMIPNYFMNRLVGIDINDPASNETVVIFSLEPLNLGTPRVQLIAQINLWVYSTLAKIFPCMLMVVYSGLLLKTLRAHVLLISRQSRLVQGSLDYSTAADERGTASPAQAAAVTVTVADADAKCYVTGSVDKRQRKGFWGILGKREPSSKDKAVKAASLFLDTKIPTSKSRRPRDNARTTRMLLTIIVLHVVTELPQAMLIILSASIPNFFTDVYLPLGDIIDLLPLINNGINFVLYCTMSGVFRKTLLSCLKLKGSTVCCPNECPRKRRRFKQNMSSTPEVRRVDCSQFLIPRSTHSHSQRTESVRTITRSS